MTSFDQLVDIAAARKGGRDALSKLIDKPKSKAALKKIPDDRWLSDMTRAVFQAGFNWSVIDKKWPGFEDAFEGFSPQRWAMMSDDDLDQLVSDTRIVRNGQKILSVRDNAVFITHIAAKHGSMGNFLASSPPSAYTELLLLLKKRASRLGGTTAQYFLRRMGVDSVIFTDHVVKALIREDVVSKAPTSQRDLAACQAAFDAWLDDGATSLTEISRVLAFTIDA